MKFACREVAIFWTNTGARGHMRIQYAHISGEARSTCAKRRHGPQRCSTMVSCPHRGSPLVEKLDSGQILSIFFICKENAAPSWAGKCHIQSLSSAPAKNWLLSRIATDFVANKKIPVKNSKIVNFFGAIFSRWPEMLVFSSHF